MASDAASDPGAAALDKLDRVLAGKPKADGQLLSEVAQSLAVYRNQLAARADRHSLDHVNAVMSIVLAAHFPLGPVPWDEVEKARGWLADMVA